MKHYGVMEKHSVGRLREARPDVPVSAAAASEPARGCAGVAVPVVRARRSSGEGVAAACGSVSVKESTKERWSRSSCQRTQATWRASKPAVSSGQRRAASSQRPALRVVRSRQDRIALCVSMHCSFAESGSDTTPLAHARALWRMCAFQYSTAGSRGHYAYMLFHELDVQARRVIGTNVFDHRCAVWGRASVLLLA